MATALTPPSFLELLMLAAPAAPALPSLPSLPALPSLPLYPRSRGAHAGRVTPASLQMGSVAWSPGGAGVRPAAAGNTPRPPFWAPGMAGGIQGGIAGGAGHDAFLSYMLPMMSMANGGRKPAPADPNVVPAVQKMLSLSVPKGGSAFEKATVYGNIIAGMGGVRGMRGHSLKRLAGKSSDSMMLVDNTMAKLNPFAEAAGAAKGGDAAAGGGDAAAGGGDAAAPAEGDKDEKSLEGEKKAGDEAPAAEEPAAA